MSNKEKQNIKSFEENYLKLEVLSKELQENKVSIDQLVPRMKEAVSAIKICKDVLQETQAQLKEISAEFADLEVGELKNSPV